MLRKQLSREFQKLHNELKKGTPAKKKPAARKAPARKTVAKKAPARKTVAKRKPAARKTVARRPARRTMRRAA